MQLEGNVVSDQPSPEFLAVVAESAGASLRQDFVEAVE